MKTQFNNLLEFIAQYSFYTPSSSKYYTFIEKSSNRIMYAPTKTVPPGFGHYYASKFSFRKTCKEIDNKVVTIDHQPYLAKVELYASSYLETI